MTTAELSTAIKMPSSTQLKILLGNANVKFGRKELSQALVLCCGQGRVEKIELLLKHGADPLFVSHPNMETPIMSAAQPSTISDDVAYRCIQVLLEAIPDDKKQDAVNAQNRVHSTALIFAASRKPKTTKLLLSYGAAVNAVDNYGNTALYFAVSNRNISTIRILIDAGADPDLRNKRGTPRERAEEIGHPAIIQALDGLKIQKESPLSASRSSLIENNKPSKGFSPDNRSNTPKSKLYSNVAAKVNSGLRSVSVDGQASIPSSASTSPEKRYKERYSIPAFELNGKSDNDADSLNGDIQNSNFVKLEAPPTSSTPMTKNPIRDYEVDPNQIDAIDESIDPMNLVGGSVEQLNELKTFLMHIDLSDLHDLFEKNNISMQELLCLDERDLEKLGVSSLGARKKILEGAHLFHITSMEKESLPSVYDRHLTCKDYVSLFSNIESQLGYIVSSTVYARRQLHRLPQVLVNTQSGATDNIEFLLDFIGKSEKCSVLLTEQLATLKNEVELVQAGHSELPSYCAPIFNKYQKKTLVTKPSTSILNGVLYFVALSGAFTAGFILARSSQFYNLQVKVIDRFLPSQ